MTRTGRWSLVTTALTRTVAATVLAGALTLAACGGADDAGAAPGARAGAEVAPTASLRPVGESGLQGWARITTGGDSLTLKLELLGVSEGTEYGAALLRGGCEGGEESVELQPPHVGSVGVGSSLTRLPGSALRSGGPHAVAVSSDGLRLSCGEFGASAGG